MKKIFALILTCLLVLGSFSVAIAAGVPTENSAATKTNASAPLTPQGAVYLVPGTYTTGGTKVENTVSSGARKLSQEECEAIFTDNAYLCTLSEGDNLPLPTSNRTDKEGNPYTFNGWWTIVDATITYFDKVPAATKTTFLYADWRADLSQRMDPVQPGGGSEEDPMHYMEITRKATGEKDILILGVSGANVSSDDLGYGQSVQLSCAGFRLDEGDVIRVYSAGLNGSKDVQLAPIVVNSSRSINLESAGDGSNVTADFLSKSAPTSPLAKPYMTCLKGGTYTIYIKFFAKGSNMAVYMEPAA